ncbi:MAG: hypothetical protein AAF353_19340 [Pseudomonadota bacterium]
MIGQQINLYQDRFREKRVWVSAGQVSTVLFLVVVAIGLYSYWLDRQLSEAKSLNQAIKADQKSMTTELAAASAELSQLLKDNRLDAEIKSASRQVSARKKVLSFVDANQFGSGQGFSEYLIALSNLHLPDVWLNRIRLAEDYVQIKGSSLKADQIPGYFDRFSEEGIFHGNRFDIFEVSRSKETNWKVDFEIATRAQDDE